MICSGDDSTVDCDIVGLLFQSSAVSDPRMTTKVGLSFEFALPLPPPTLVNCPRGSDATLYRKFEIEEVSMPSLTPLPRFKPTNADRCGCC